MHRELVSKTGLAKKMGTGLWLLCLVTGTVLLVAGQGIRVPGIGLALTATAFFWRLGDPRRIRSLAKFMIPILVFLAAYGLLLHLYAPVGPPASPSVSPAARVAHLFLRSLGLLFAMFALEEVLRPLALRARSGEFKGTRIALMLSLSYQLVPVFLQSLEGVLLAQRARSRLWWLHPSNLMRSASSLFLMSHRLSEEMALALSLRLGRGGPAESDWARSLSTAPVATNNSAEDRIEP
jgi:energy-coupling factor transporter transmembrane protein EcfT